MKLRFGCANGWTGGQYSLWRAAVGLGFAALSVDRACERGRASWFAIALLWVLFASGAFARTAAALLAAVWVLGTKEFAADANFAPLLFPAVLGWNALLPRAPYGSLPARGRADPAGGWRVQPWLLGLAWTCVWVAVAGSAAVLLAWRDRAPRPHVLHAGPEPAPEAWWLDPPSAWAFLAAALAFATLAWSARARPWLLLALAAVLCAGWARVEAPAGAAWRLDLFVPTWLLALSLLVDPAWIPARGGDVVERLFYDGECGLCQRTVRFVLAEDPDGRRFRFAPLQGETFARELDRDVRARLPDSLVVKTADGRVLVRSDAVAHLLQRLGGLWRVFGALFALVPRPLRDLGYDGVARVRKRIFAAPKTLCPLGPERIADRFDA